MINIWKESPLISATEWEKKRENQKNNPQPMFPVQETIWKWGTTAAALSSVLGVLIVSDFSNHCQCIQEYYEKAQEHVDSFIYLKWI